MKEFPFCRVPLSGAQGVPDCAALLFIAAMAMINELSISVQGECQSIRTSCRLPHHKESGYPVQCMWRESQKVSPESSSVASHRLVLLSDVRGSSFRHLNSPCTNGCRRSITVFCVDGFVAKMSRGAQQRARARTCCVAYHIDCVHASALVGS